MVDNRTRRSLLCLELPLSAEAPRAARVRLRRWCREIAVEQPRCETLELLASELVTNAVLHSDAAPDSDIKVRAQADSDTIRVEVVDRGERGRPHLREPAGVRGGYGLHIVAGNARRWGVELDGETRVWFEA